MDKGKTQQIAISLELYEKLKSLKRHGQSFSGIIQDLIWDREEEVCPLCSKHSSGCKVHKECADYEQWWADRKRQ